MIESVRQGYERSADHLVAAYEAVSSEAVLAPVLDLMPALDPIDGRRPRVLDIGAGTGRDAAWLADRGHDVVAVEPVRALREAGMRLHPSPRIRWVDDSLPHLPRVADPDGGFDLILMIGVWQHIDPRDRLDALCSLRRLAAADARVILSVRHGPGASSRPSFPVTDSQTIDQAAQAGLTWVDSRVAASVQQANRDAGVVWTWLVLGAPPAA